MNLHWVTVLVACTAESLLWGYVGLQCSHAPWVAIAGIVWSLSAEAGLLGLPEKQHSVLLIVALLTWAWQEPVKMQSFPVEFKKVRDLGGAIDKSASWV